MAIYSGTQRIFQISKWWAAAKITYIFGLVLKIKQEQIQRPKERGWEGGREEEGKRKKEGGGKREKEQIAKLQQILHNTFFHHFPA